MKAAYVCLWWQSATQIKRSSVKCDFPFFSPLGQSGLIRNCWSCPRSLPMQKINKIGAIFHLFCQNIARAWLFEVKTMLSDNIECWVSAFQYKIVQLLAQTCEYPLLCLLTSCQDAQPNEKGRGECMKHMKTCVNIWMSDSDFVLAVLNTIPPNYIQKQQSLLKGNVEKE